jgi:hypothetical protein
MDKPTSILVCPACERTCRTGREARPGAKMRCPGCHRVFFFSIQGNGAVLLRPANEPSSTMECLRDLAGVEPATGSRLPRRVGEHDETESTRKILRNRRRNHPLGGYAPFEKSRSWIGTFALCAAIGLGVLAASWYVRQIDTIATATGRTGANPGQSYDEGKRRDFQARQKRALENLKKQQATVQSAGAKAEDGRLPAIKLITERTVFVGSGIGKQWGAFVAAYECARAN